jgi:hypothetical protein
MSSCSFPNERFPACPGKKRWAAKSATLDKRTVQLHAQVYGDDDTSCLLRLLCLRPQNKYDSSIMKGTLRRNVGGLMQRESSNFSGIWFRSADYRIWQSREPCCASACSPVERGLSSIVYVYSLIRRFLQIIVVEPVGKGRPVAMARGRCVQLAQKMDISAWAMRKEGREIPPRKSATIQTRGAKIKRTKERTRKDISILLRNQRSKIVER